MGREFELRADSPTVQVAGVVPRWIVLPGNLLGRERTVNISPRCVAHIKARHPRSSPAPRSASRRVRSLGRRPVALVAGVGEVSRCAA